MQHTADNENQPIARLKLWLHVQFVHAIIAQVTTSLPAEWLSAAASREQHSGIMGTTRHVDRLTVTTWSIYLHKNIIMTRDKLELMKMS